MLSDLIDDLIKAKKNGSAHEVEACFHRLERIGVDRITAKVMMRARITDRSKKN